MPNEKEKLRELGCLSIDFHHANVIATSDIAEEHDPTEEIGMVSEKAIKGRDLSHGVG